MHRTLDTSVGGQCLDMTRRDFSVLVSLVPRRYGPGANRSLGGDFLVSSYWPFPPLLSGSLPAKCGTHVRQPAVEQAWEYLPSGVWGRLQWRWIEYKYSTPDEGLSQPKGLRPSVAQSTCPELRSIFHLTVPSFFIQDGRYARRSRQGQQCRPRGCA